MYVRIFFFAGMLLAGYYGIEIVARVSAFLVPIILVLFILTTFGVIPEFKIDHLFPILGEGYSSILMGSCIKLSAFASFIILFLMVPFFKNQYLKRIGFSYILISGLLLFWSTLSFILIFPYESAVDKTIPIFQMARYISFGDYIQRIESIIVLIASVCALLYLGAVFSIAIQTFTKTFDLKKSKPIILPMAVIVFSLSVLLNRVKIELLGSNKFNLIWLTGMVLPLLIIVIGAIKKVGKKDAGGIKNGQKN
jgi:hypothetical protein